MRHATGTILSTTNLISRTIGCGCLTRVIVVSRTVDPLDDRGAIADAVRRVVPVDIVGIEPQAYSGEGVVLQIEVTNRESLGNCGCRIVRTVTCLVGSDRGGSGGTDLNGFSIALHLCHQTVGTGEGDIQTRACHCGGDEVEVTHRLCWDHIKGDRLVGLVESCRQGSRWGRGVGGISWLGRSQGDRAGGLDLQAVKVPVSIPVELPNQGGVHLPIVKTHIVNLAVEVATARIAITSNDYILGGIGINRGGARSVGSCTIYIELGCSRVGCRGEANRQMMPCTICQAGGGTGDGGTT